MNVLEFHSLEELIAIVERLPPAGGQSECGEEPDEQAALKATFRHGIKGPALAEVEEKLPPSECPFVDFTGEHGKRVLLDEDEHFRYFLQEVLSGAYGKALSSILEP